MEKFVALLASGVAYGAILALAACGFLVLYKATGILNFAHAALIALGAYLALWANRDLRLPIVPAYALALVLMFVVGVVLERIAHAPLRRRSPMVIVIATLAAALVIQALLSLWQGGNPQALESPAGDDTFQVAGASIAYQRMVVVAVAVVAVVGLLLIFQRTSLGRQLRALASDPETAQMYGVRARLVASLAFGISAVFAGLAGILVAPLTSVDLTFGFPIMMGAFAAAILGGFGSLIGIAVGAFLIGIAQQVVGAYLVPDYADMLPFALIFVVIAFRPEGLFGRATEARL